MASVSREVDRQHKSLLVKLGDMMNPNERTYRSFICCLESDILQRGRLSMVQENPTDVFALMEEKGVLQPGKYETLKEALQDKAATVSSIDPKGPDDYTPSCKESARTTTSSSCQHATSKVKVGKLQRNWNDTSAGDEKVAPVPLSLFCPSGRPGNMKSPFDETDTVCNQRLCVDLAKSIGIIKSPYGTFGTGFQVGFDLIMTAKHVKDDILNAVPGQFHGLSPSYCINHLSDAFIDFSYEVHGVPDNDNLKFYFKPEIVYENEDMDTVILRLKSNNHLEYPPPLTFAELSDPCGQLYLIGHSRADIKKTDKFHCVQLMKEVKTDAEKWSIGYVGRNGFKGIDNPCRLLFHCTFEKGASGSPGVWIYQKNHQTYARVVTMLLFGYPDWYYDNTCPQEKKDGIPHHLCVEQGVCMRSLSENMKVTKPDLWQEIFSKNSNDDDEEEMK